MSGSCTNRAALYVRASSEHQDYSTSHQEAALRAYAEEQDEGAAVYRDEGRSGLSLDGRAGLIALFEAIKSGKADFTALFVYDVSRWGRFQNVDEAPYYEYGCRRAGIAVSYCAEPFANDGSPLPRYSRDSTCHGGRIQPRAVVEGFPGAGSID